MARRSLCSTVGLLVLAVLVLGCQEPTEPASADATGPSDASAASPSGEVPTSGLGAVERFMETWNTRDENLWATSLVFPHTRPAIGSSRVFESAAEYVESFDYASVIATGWDRTVFESLEVIHEGRDKAHVAGRWARLDAEGEVIRRNLVSYVATRSVEADDGGSWGVKARFSAGAPLAADDARRQENERAAIAKVEEYMTAFNARDPEAWAATLHYPHVRLAGGDIVVTETAERMAESLDFDAFAERFNWHHSGWDSIRAVQIGAEAANVALTFSRYDDQNRVTSTFDTLYLVTLEDGRWGIRARSSFAP